MKINPTLIEMTTFKFVPLGVPLLLADDKENIYMRVEAPDTDYNCVNLSTGELGIVRPLASVYVTFPNAELVLHGEKRR